MRAARTIGIVGAGPAGVYLADALLRSSSQLRVEVIDRLLTPYGLIRYGVAGDHLSTKSITRVLDRTMSCDRATFRGGIHVGVAVDWNDLRACYDALVIAIGAQEGRALPLGRTGSRVITGFDLLLWANGHPDSSPLLPPEKPKSVIVIGGGNVSLDVARLFAMNGTDLDRRTDFPTRTINYIGSRITKEIHVVARSAATGTRYSKKELDEISGISGVCVHWHSGCYQDDNVPSYPESPRFSQEQARCTEVHFHFGASPTRFDGRSVHLAGERELVLEADLLVEAIGQRVPASCKLPLDDRTGFIENCDGAVTGSDGLFVVGWAAGTSRGGIGEMRTEAQKLAPKILFYLSHLKRRSLLSASDLFGRLNAPPSSWNDWILLDSVEVARGRLGGRPREKILGWAEMRKVVCGQVEGSLCS